MPPCRESGPQVPQSAALWAYGAIDDVILRSISQFTSTHLPGVDKIAFQILNLLVFALQFQCHFLEFLHTDRRCHLRVQMLNNGLKIKLAKRITNYRALTTSRLLTLLDARAPSAAARSMFVFSCLAYSIFQKRENELLKISNAQQCSLQIGYTQGLR